VESTINFEQWFVIIGNAIIIITIIIIIIITIIIIEV